MLQTVVLKHALLLLSDFKSTDAAFILELKGRLCCTVLQRTKHLNNEFRILDVATTPAEVFVLYIRVADITLILDLDELGFHNKAKDFEHMPDNRIGWNGLDQTDGLIRLEICDLILNLADNAEISNAEL